jgi:hypothetical protein
MLEEDLEVIKEYFFNNYIPISRYFDINKLKQSPETRIELFNTDSLYVGFFSSNQTKNDIGILI